MCVCVCVCLGGGGVDDFAKEVVQSSLSCSLFF